MAIDLDDVERIIIEAIPRVERICEDDYDFGYLYDTIITDPEFKELVENDGDNIDDLIKYMFVFGDKQDILDPERIMDFIVNPYTQKIYNILGDDMIVIELSNYSIDEIINTIRNILIDFD